MADSKREDDESNEADEMLSENVKDQKKQPKRTLFNDLRRFKNKKVTILLFGGNTVQGKLLGYDEVANCVIENQTGKKSVIFGKAISMVCQGDLHPF